MRRLATVPLLSIAVIVFAAPAAFSADKENKDAPQTVTVKVEDLKLEVPKTWKQKPPSNKLRKAQFEVPPAKGNKESVEIVIYEFPGGGGAVGANIKRWMNQFQAKGRKSKITTGESEQGKYVTPILPGVDLA